MEWPLKILGESVTYTLSENVTAVRPTDVSSIWSLDDIALTFGETIVDEPSVETVAAGPPNDLDVFRKAGWHFVHPHPETLAMTHLGPHTSNSASVHQVVESDTGNMLITTELATVRFIDEKLSDQQARNLLTEDALTVVYKFGFAPNTFEVRLPPGRPLPEIIGALQAKTDRYRYAEPSFLQVINGRHQEPGIASGNQWQHINNGLGDGVAGIDLGSPIAWEITKGARIKRVRVAVIDNGMQISHRDLNRIVDAAYYQNTIVGETQFMRFTPGLEFPDDDHGTLCLGLIGAAMNNVDGCGIAPDVDLMPIACMVGQTGAIEFTGTQATLARAVHYAVDPSYEDGLIAPDRGAHVISCSLNTHKLLQSNLYDAFTFASKKGRGGNGVPIFWAVDNHPTKIDDDKVFSHSHPIAVARHDRAGKKVRSAFGKRLDYLAPGEEVYSTGSNNNFKLCRGTSYATPLAAGIAALVLSIQPEWTADEVRTHLNASCQSVGLTPEEEGRGRLSAAIAVTKAKPPDL